MNKAKVGDKIQSFNVSGLPDRGFHIGTVTKVEIDPTDDVEYVFFHSEYEVNGTEVRLVNRSVRVVQNGTPNQFEEVMECIVVLSGK